MDSHSYPQRNCWTCKYQQRGGITLLGYCLYWEQLGKEKKEIPPSVVDLGCKYYKERSQNEQKKKRVLQQY